MPAETGIQLLFLSVAWIPTFASMTLYLNGSSFTVIVFRKHSMKVFLFRHGEVQTEKEKIFLGRTDLPLSAKGREQADTWKARFAGRLPGRIGSSPLCRASEFARIIAVNRAKEVKTYPALSEIDLGEWDGRPMAEIRANDPASWKARGEDFAGFRPPGGESFTDLQQRVIPAFEALTAEADTNLLLVCHAGVNRVILCHLLGMPLANLFCIGQDPGCLNIVEKSRQGIRVAGINSVLSD